MIAPDVKRMIADLQNRVGVLERRVTTRAATAETVETIMFSYSGTLAASLSPPTRPHTGGILTILAVTLGTPGTSDVELVVARNAIPVATVTVPAGVAAYNGEVNARFAAESDLLSVAIVDGGGAADMTAEARF